MSSRPLMVLAGLMAGIAGNAIGYADDGGPRSEHRVAAAGVLPQGGRPLRAVTALAGVASIVPPAPTPAPAPLPKPPGPCPDGMARIGKSCIDRPEAHLVENIWFKGRWGSEVVFALLRREWEERRR